MKIEAINVKVGDFLEVNTGYSIGDDESCEVLAIEKKNSLFNEEQICFILMTSYGPEEYCVNVKASNGQLTKVTIKG